MCEAEEVLSWLLSEIEQKSKEHLGNVKGAVRTLQDRCNFEDRYEQDRAVDAVLELEGSVASFWGWCARPAAPERSQATGGGMKREDWKKVEDRLCFPGARASLCVDGRAVVLEVRTDKMKMVIQVYVDGWVEGEWLDHKKSCPEQRYMRRLENYLWSKKQRDEAAKWAKRYGKLEARKLFGDMDKKVVFFSPYFPSVRAVRTHYEKTFSSIELVTE